MGNIKLNINLGTIILIGVVVFIVLGGGFGLQKNKINKLEDKLVSEENLKNALVDSVSSYKNEKNEWVSEKLTIQTSISELEKDKVQLTKSQKELMARVLNVEKEKEKIKKEKEVIAAALLQTKIVVDSLSHVGETVVDTTSKLIVFSDKYENTINDINYNVNYSLTIGNVLPVNPLVKPTLFVDSLYFPNEQFVDFHWNNEKKKGYPISFSVSNSNGFYKTTNIDSYAIPNLKKELVNPTGWQKFTSFFDRNSQKLVYIGVGGALGIGSYIILTQ